MPAIIQGAIENKLTEGYADKVYDYQYPDGIDLSPRSDTHKKIVDLVIKFANEGATSISTRFPAWQEIDRTLTAYIDLDDSEEDLLTHDSRKPVSIVFPYSYAILETVLSYLIAAFYQEPIFRYEGVSPGDTIGAILMSKIVDMQCYKSKVLLNLHTMFRDAISYGFGFVGTGWERNVIKRYQPSQLSLGPFSFRKGRELVDKVEFEGNKLVNFNPYRLLPDPDVSVTDFQKGQFFGYVEESNIMALMRDEKNDNERFNVRYLRHLKNKRTALYSKGDSGRADKTGHESGRMGDSNAVDVIKMYLDLFPDELGIGDDPYPQRFLIEVAADSIITRFKRLDLNHGRFPASMCAPDYDGYSITPVSRLEILNGLQGVLDFFLNSHVANARKAVNDTLIVDPEVINVPDLKKPTGKEGGIVRIRKPYWGMGKIKDSIEQLKISDVTRGHVADAAQIQDAMERIAGVDATTMGVLRKGGPERLTKGEFQGTQAGTFTRLERMAKIIGIQAMQDIGTIFAYHTQQFMKEETYVSIAGKWQEQLISSFKDAPGNFEFDRKTGKVKITPYDLLVDFDLKVRDGSVPGGNYSPVWERMFEIIASQPELAQQFDLVKIFKHIARNNGEKNVENYVRVKTMPDEQAANQAAKGNIIPISGTERQA